MIPRMVRPTLVSLIAASVLATGLFAQSPAPKIDFPDPSPAATVKQRVGLTDIEINYYRPSMRGRKIFGGLQPYGEIWRTGANNATKVTFSTAVKFAGADVPAGSYALFTIPGETEWTVILNKVTGQWGAYSYDEKNDLVRVKARPFALPLPVETFVITFNHVEEGSALLELAWDKTLIPVKIEVDIAGALVPQIEAVMNSSEAKKPYFRAAMFYYDNSLDLKKAAAWMDAAIAEQPDAFYMIYRKGLILEKAGDKAGALAAAQKSLEMARKAPGLVGTEYVRLDEALIARAK